MGPLFRPRRLQIKFWATDPEARVVGDRVGLGAGHSELPAPPFRHTRAPTSVIPAPPSPSYPRLPRVSRRQRAECREPPSALPALPLVIPAPEREPPPSSLRRPPTPPAPAPRIRHPRLDLEPTPGLNRAPKPNLTRRRGSSVGCCSQRDTRGKRGYDDSGGIGVVDEHHEQRVAHYLLRKTPDDEHGETARRARLAAVSTLLGRTRP